MIDQDFEKRIKKYRFNDFCMVWNVHHVSAIRFSRDVSQIRLNY